MYILIILITRGYLNAKGEATVYIESCEPYKEDNKIKVFDDIAEVNKVSHQLHEKMQSDNLDIKVTINIQRYELPAKYFMDK